LGQRQQKCAGRPGYKKKRLTTLFFGCCRAYGYRCVSRKVRARLAVVFLNSLTCTATPLPSANPSPCRASRELSPPSKCALPAHVKKKTAEAVFFIDHADLTPVLRVVGSSGFHTTGWTVFFFNRAHAGVQALGAAVKGNGGAVTQTAWALDGAGQDSGVRARNGSCDCAAVAGDSRQASFLQVFFR
jgi:hypothetical protein